MGVQYGLVVVVGGVIIYCWVINDEEERLLQAGCNYNGGQMFDTCLAPRRTCGDSDVSTGRGLGHRDPAAIARGVLAFLHRSAVEKAADGILLLVALRKPIKQSRLNDIPQKL